MTLYEANTVKLTLENDDGEFVDVTDPCTLVAKAFGISPASVHRTLQLAAGRPPRLTADVFVPPQVWIVRDDEALKRYNFWSTIVRGQSALAILRLAAFFDRPGLPGAPRRVRVNVVNAGEWR